MPSVKATGIANVLRNVYATKKAPATKSSFACW